MNLFQKVFGTRSEHEVKRIMPLVEKTESLRPEMQKLTDEQLRDKTREFKKRLGEGETLDDLLPEASWYGTLPCTDHRWYHPSSGTYRRDEDR